MYIHTYMYNTNTGTNCNTNSEAHKYADLLSALFVCLLVY